MHCVVRALQVTGVAGVAVAALATLGAPREPRLLTESRLREVVGASKQYHVQTLQSCDEESASGTGGVASDACAGNENKVCIQCAPPEGNPTNMIIQQGYGGVGPGIKPAPNWSCGPLSAGTCTNVNGVLVCNNPTPLGINCTDAYEYQNQP